MVNMKLPFFFTPRNLYTPIILGILLLAIALRLIGLNKGLWLDEYFSVRWLEIGNLTETTMISRRYIF
jgi:hypothetical protein